MQKFSDQAIAASVAMLTAAKFTADAIARGDTPERIAEAVSDVTRWSQRLLEDVQAKLADDQRERLAETAKPEENPEPVRLPAAEPQSLPRLDLHALKAEDVDGDLSDADRRLARKLAPGRR